MDSEILVGRQLEDGQRLIDQLVRDEFPVRVALWAKGTEDGIWSLYIAAHSVDPDKLGEAFRAVYTSLAKIPSPRLDLSVVKLLNGTHPLARTAVAARDRHEAGAATRIPAGRFGGIELADVYVYPPPHKWFQGFDELKANFPSAKVFTLPVLFEDSHPVHIGVELGAINATEFEGRAPRTVMYFGPHSHKGREIAEIFFVYRPEGWNTIYRPDTGRYEEVTYAGGHPLYPSADFGPFLAIKADRKPAQDQIDRIKQVVREGGQLSLHPLKTRYAAVPFVQEDEGVLMDWEDLRRFLEEGGTIHVHGPNPSGRLD